MSDLEHSPRLKALRLLKAIEREGDRATETIMVAEAGGWKGYQAYFGENGALTRIHRWRPHSITGVNEIVEVRMVKIWLEERKNLHGRTEDGKRYQKLLHDLIYYWEPYSEVRKGRLTRGK